MPSSAQSWSNSWAPDGARAREAKSRSVNSFPIVRQYPGNSDRAGPVQVAQEPSGIRCGLGGHDAHKHPPYGPVDGDEQVRPGGLTGHLRQEFDVDMQEAGLTGRERLVRLCGRPGPQGIEIAYPMTAQIAPSGPIGSSPMARDPDSSATLQG